MTDPNKRDHQNRIEWIRPKRWEELGALAFRLDELPDQEFMLIFPEWFACREMSTGAPMQWSDFPLTRSWEDGPYSATLTFRPEESGHQIHLKWECTFTNGSDRALTDLCAFNCLNLNWAPLFQDLAMERTRVTDGGGAGVILREVPKTQGEGKRTMQFYPASGGVELEHNERIPRYGVTSSACLSGDRIAVDSRDGRWRLESAVDGRVAFFFNNWEADHGCVHAAPLLGTLRPGESAAASGQVTFTRKR
jgi:hypothetical protein